MIVLSEIEKKRLDELLEKYNDVLMQSMKNAIAEDLWNLIVVNHDDHQYSLVDLMNKKHEYKNYVLKEFLLMNSSPVLRELKKMEKRGPKK